MNDEKTEQATLVDNEQATLAENVQTAPADNEQAIPAENGQPTPSANLQPELPVSAPVYEPAPAPAYTQAPPVYTQAPPPAYPQTPPPAYPQAPPVYPQAPPPMYTQAPPPMYNQAPPQAYCQAPPQMYDQAYAPMYPPARPAPKISRLTLVATVAASFSAAVTAVSWFLPYVRVEGESYNVLWALNNEDIFKNFRWIFWVFLGVCALSVLWAVIPKQWAAIIGTVQSSLYLANAATGTAGMFWFVRGSGFELDFGVYLMLPAAALTLLWTIIKLVSASGDKKRYRKSIGR